MDVIVLDIVIVEEPQNIIDCRAQIVPEETVGYIPVKHNFKDIFQCNNFEGMFYAIERRWNESVMKY
eukprot:56056-Ditylum_brightwellii.AAC.1